MLPVIIKQLLSAPNTPGSDEFKIDGADVNQVSIVGSILTVTETSTNLQFRVDDGTGRIDVKIWIDSEDNEYNQQKRSAWREGVYVRVYGHLRAFNNQRSVVAFSIQPITNFNEVTYHFLEVIYVHLYHTKGPLTSVAAASNTTSTNSNSNYYQQSTYDYNDLQTAIIDTCRSNSQTYSQAGISIHFVVEQLSNMGATYEQVRSACDFLIQEGHLYSTTDDDHLKLTGTQ